MALHHIPEGKILNLFLIRMYFLRKSFKLYQITTRLFPKGQIGKVIDYHLLWSRDTSRVIHSIHFDIHRRRSHKNARYAMSLNRIMLQAGSITLQRLEFNYRVGYLALVRLAKLALNTLGHLFEMLAPDGNDTSVDKEFRMDVSVLREALQNSPSHNCETIVKALSEKLANTLAEQVR